MWYALLSHEYELSNRSSSRPLFGAGLHGDDEDDEWLLSSTPDVLKLGGLGAGVLSSDEDVSLVGAMDFHRYWCAIHPRNAQVCNTITLEGS